MKTYIFQQYGDPFKTAVLVQAETVEEAHVLIESFFEQADNGGINGLLSELTKPVAFPEPPEAP